MNGGNGERRAARLTLPLCPASQFYIGALGTRSERPGSRLHRQPTSKDPRARPWGRGSTTRPTERGTPARPPAIPARPPLAKQRPGASRPRRGTQRSREPTMLFYLIFIFHVAPPVTRAGEKAIRVERRERLRGRGHPGEGRRRARERAEGGSPDDPALARSRSRPLPLTAYLPGSPRTLGRPAPS